MTLSIKQRRVRRPSRNSISLITWRKTTSTEIAAATNCCSHRFRGAVCCRCRCSCDSCCIWLLNAFAHLAATQRESEGGRSQSWHVVITSDWFMSVAGWHSMHSIILDLCLLLISAHEWPLLRQPVAARFLLANSSQSPHQNWGIGPAPVPEPLPETELVSMCIYNYSTAVWVAGNGGGGG